jgi:K+-transporting ATPase KdpF subunit
MHAREETEPHRAVFLRHGVGAYVVSRTDVSMPGATVGRASSEVRGGYCLSADSRGSLRGEPRTRLGARPAGEVPMSLMYWLSGLLALFLFGYLLYALLRAERF